MNVFVVFLSNGTYPHISHDYTGSHPIIQDPFHYEGGLHGDDALGQLILVRRAPWVGGGGVVKVLGYKWIYINSINFAGQFIGKL